MLRRWDVELQQLTPLLSDEGIAFEERVTKDMQARGERILNLADEDAAKTVEWLRNARSPVNLLQPAIEGRLGQHEYRGRADIVRLWRDGGGLHAYIADVKASRRERTEHRVQIAAYARLLRGMAADAGVPLTEVRGGVLHMQQDGTLPQLDPNQYFDLDTYDTTLCQLAVDDGCTVDEVRAQPFDQVPYHLGYHCDVCPYNAICMHDTAERRDLSLVPYLTATEKRVLQQHNVNSLDQLAPLLDYSPDKKGMVAARGHEAKVKELANAWPLSITLPTVAQHARAAMRRIDKQTPSLTYLVGNGFPTLPDEEAHPGLVKIFFDAQHDYLQDHVYLLAGMVVGPQGTKCVVRFTQEPPTLESEGEILTDWVALVLKAVAECANGTEAFVHLYCYNAYDQRVLLEAMKRHLSAVTQLPGFFDLMTQHPALDQPIISFLSQEVQAHMNLGKVCTPLHDMAQMLGFDWTRDDLEFKRLFRTRLFDNSRPVVRSYDGRLAPAPPSVSEQDPRRMFIESASRFNSQIPLEYAYAAWGRLPEPRNGKERLLLSHFTGITRRHVALFAAQRLRALAFVEGKFRYKSRYTDKHKLDLTRLNVPAENASLAQSLREFLVMEHHASLQASLQTYALPIERRMQTGLALLLRCKEQFSHETYRFTVAFDMVGLDRATVMNGLRLKETSWVVVNPLLPPLSANQLKHGRLAIVDEVGEDWLTLTLTNLSTTKNGSADGTPPPLFKYYHKRELKPQAGELYTLDEMADDLNADKQLEALNHSSTNTLYNWLNLSPGVRTVLPAAVQQAERFVEAVNELERPNRMTGVQKQIVGGNLDAPLLLVQGPPGTGKSHTIGWAVLNRLLLAHTAGRPCRVAVVCKTHNAVNIVLESIAKKWRKLAGVKPRGIGLEDFGWLRVVKLGGEDGNGAPEGMEMVNPYAQFGKLDDLVGQSFVVVGATPGYLYNLARYRGLGGKGSVDWTAKPFDLLVIDEASQMSVPEAVLAGAFLRTDGAMLVVGDHRQMPPIVAHTWEQEEKRTVKAAQPYLSLFEFLIDRGFPRESLDQSFRLHHTIADFLQANIYVRDGIHFFSKRKDLLDLSFAVDPFVRAVMAPEYPIVVVEHGEHGSHQYNETEFALVEPLIRCAQDLRLDGTDGVGVVVPHRAQKAMLRAKFPALADLDAIDTVERFQGGERDVIVVSATASDPDYVLAEADFLLNLNRLNVALSRPRKKLIAVASQSVTRLLLSDLAVFDNAVIWKRLYYQYATKVLWMGKVNGVPVIVRGTPADNGLGLPLH